MSKKSAPPAPLDVARALERLVQKTAPGRVTIEVPRHAALKEIASYEVMVDTRRGGTGCMGHTIEEAVAGALESLESPSADEVDPIIPSWYRLSRMQREMVEQTLRRYAADAMARAAEAKIAHDERGAGAQYAMADAFRAALDILAFEDTDDAGNLLPQEPLAAEPEAKARRARA